MQRMLLGGVIGRVNPWWKVSCFESIFWHLHMILSVFSHANLSVLYHFYKGRFRRRLPPPMLCLMLPILVLPCESHMPSPHAIT